MKWLVRSVLALVVLVAIAAIAFVMIPTERITRLAADRFETATGRALTLGGPVKATLWPSLGVRAEGIEVANAPWSDAGPMLMADSLEVGIAFGALLGGDIRIETLEVTGARLVLERRADGTANWEMAATSRPSAGGDAGRQDGSTGRGISIDRAVLNGAEVLWTDAVTGTDLHLRAVDLATRLDGLDDPLDVTLSALVEGQSLSIEASAVALGPLPEGESTPVALSLEASQTSLRLEGRAALDPPSFEGRMEAESGDRLALLSVLGIAPPDLPEGLGADRIDLAAAVTLTPAGTLHLHDMVAELDGNRLTGVVEIDPTGARPRLTATIAAEALDLTVFSREGQGGDGAVVAERGWGRETFDVSGLFVADGELTFSSGPITLGDATLDGLHARVSVEDGRATVLLQPLLAFGGAVTGEVVVNGRGGLSTQVALKLSGLQMQPFLTEVADFDRLVGQADISIALLGAGNTMQALVDSLAGTASVRLGQGELLGLDIGGMVRNRDLDFRGEGRKTVFDGFSASFAVAEGVATGHDLTLEAPYLVASGAGDIALGAQTLNYRLIPSVRAEEGGQTLSAPILIEGPWADPRIGLDLDLLAQSEIDEARARVEAEARTRLAEELEVDPGALESRESIEGAIADRVAEKLLELLGGR